MSAASDLAPGNEQFAQKLFNTVLVQVISRDACIGAQIIAYIFCFQEQRERLGPLLLAVFVFFPPFFEQRVADAVEQRVADAVLPFEHRVADAVLPFEQRVADAVLPFEQRVADAVLPFEQRVADAVLPSAQKLVDLVHAEVEKSEQNAKERSFCPCAGWIQHCRAGNPVLDAKAE